MAATTGRPTKTPVEPVVAWCKRNGAENSLPLSCDSRRPQSPDDRPGPFVLIPAAIKAGRGELGKHGSMIHPTFGSNFRLANVPKRVFERLDHGLRVGRHWRLDASPDS
jgi:hypothetical protein